MDTNETDDRESEVEGSSQHNHNEKTKDVVSTTEDSWEKNQGNNCKVQTKEGETEEVFPNNDNRKVQQDTSDNEESGPTEVQEGNNEAVQQGIFNEQQGKKEEVNEDNMDWEIDARPMQLPWGNIEPENDSTDIDKSYFGHVRFNVVWNKPC